MFGFIHESLRQLMVRNHGEDFWTSVLEHAGIEANKENVINHHYPDSDTFAIVDSVSVLSRMPREEVWELYGQFFVEFVIEAGWEEMLRAMSPNLKGFLNNLDSLHYFIDHVVYKANMRGPSFRCEENKDETITLHYLSTRSGLYPIVKGVLREIARRIYQMEIGIAVTGRTQRSVQLSTGERVEEHVIFQIKLSGSQKDISAASSPAALTPQMPVVDATCDWALKISTFDFANIMPYHVVIDRDCKLVQTGFGLQDHITPDLLVPGTPLLRIFEIHRPQIPLDYENICNFINGVFILQSRSIPLAVQQQQQQSGSLHASRNSHGSENKDIIVGEEFANAQHLKLKGQMMLIDNGDMIVYLCSPYVTNVAELQQYGLRLSAFALHDATRDLILLNQQRLTDVEENMVLEQNNEQLEEMGKELNITQQHVDSLTADVLPPHVGASLSGDGELARPREFEEATILYADVPGFHSLIHHPDASIDDAVQLLAELFIRFDRLVQLHDLFRVHGLAESYVVVGGVPEVAEDHAETMLHIALGMEWKARAAVEQSKSNGSSVNTANAVEPLLVRCGIHTGPVTAGVIQQNGMPRYHIFGKTVSTAMRLAWCTQAGRIHVSEETRECAERFGRFEFESRGRVDIPGVEEQMQTYYLKRSYKKSIWEIINRQRDENINSIDGYAELGEVLGGELANTAAAIRGARSCNIL